MGGEVGWGQMCRHDWHLCGQTSGSRALLCGSHVRGFLSVSMSLCFFVFCVFASLYLSFLGGLCFSNKSLWVSVSLYFIYLFLAVLGLRFCARAFSNCGKWGPLFIAVRGPLTIAASLVAGHRLQTRRLSNCGSRA